jgi:hypothetical protein
MNRLQITHEEKLLQDAEQIDNYLKLCKESSVNSLARSHSAYIPHSSDPAIKWSSKLPAWILPVAKKTKVIWMHPSADAGLPHTRPGCLVCMPQYFPESRMENTLLHELIHVSQREHPDEWRKLYRIQGWRRARDDEIEKIPDEIYDKIRLNPDTIMTGQFWVWGNTMPLPVFDRLDKPQLTEADVRWLDLDKGYLFRSPPQEFQRYFGPVHDPEHPAEVAAYSLADPATYKKYPAWKTFSDIIKS